MGSFLLKRVKIKNAKDGYMFNLYASNHMIVATSQIYSSLSVCKKGILSVVRNAEIAEIEDQTENDFEVQKNPKFELYVDAGGQFRFRLRATNGEKILASQGYTNKVNCRKGIQSVKTNIVSPRYFMEDGDETVELTLSINRNQTESVIGDSAEMVMFTERPLVGGDEGDVHRGDSSVKEVAVVAPQNAMETVVEKPIKRKSEPKPAAEKKPAQPDPAGGRRAAPPKPAEQKIPAQPKLPEKITESAAATAPVTEGKPQKKKGLFARLFGGRKGR